MPTTPIRRNPKSPAFHHTVDRRQHPIPDMLYRVLDPNWTTLWGQNLEWKDAKALKTSVAGKRLSSTVMIEAEDLPVPEKMHEAAAVARQALMATGVSPALAPTSVPVATRPPPPVPPALQRGALDAAGRAAAEANARTEAAQRRAMYKQQQLDAQKEADALAKKAAELDGGDDVPDAELDDFLAGTGGMPTDDEIKKAKAAAQK